MTLLQKFPLNAFVFVVDEASEAGTLTDQALSMQAEFDVTPSDNAVSFGCGVDEFGSVIVALADRVQRLDEVVHSFRYRLMRLSFL